VEVLAEPRILPGILWFIPYPDGRRQGECPLLVAQAAIRVSVMVSLKLLGVFVIWLASFSGCLNMMARF